MCEVPKLLHYWCCYYYYYYYYYYCCCYYYYCNVLGLKAKLESAISNTFDAISLQGKARLS